MELSGTVESVIFRNSETGFTVVKILSKSNLVTVSGKFPIIGVGEMLRLKGEFIVNKKYGEQFEAEEVFVETPQSRDAIERYLACGLIPGVGAATAKNIVKVFGEKTLDIIENSPGLLSGIRGISLRKATEIHNALSEIKKMQQAVMFLQKYDISISLAVKIFNKYKNKTEEVLTANPYLLIEDVDGIGFKTADKIALKLGVKTDSMLRMRAAIIFVLNEIAEKQGSTIVKHDEIIAAACEALEIDQSNSDSLSAAIADLEITGVVREIDIDGSEWIAFNKFYSMEKYIAQKLSALSKGQQLSLSNLDGQIEQFEKLNKISLHENQKQAVIAGVTENVVVITGGPGTGKTTIVNAILSILKGQNLKCMLMAPTGRAAKRLEEQTHEPASTIHRALEANFAKVGHGFLRNENNPLEADAVIVDEVSMLDVFLMSGLLKALPFDAKLILVGDKDQLPSVGPGNVLADIIASDLFKVIKLTQIYRQSDDSMIVVNAHKINNSEMPDLSVKSNDFFYSSIAEPEFIANEILGLLSDRIPKYFVGLSSDDVQVICPLKSGVVGTNNLNGLIQARLNPASETKGELTLQKRVFREGDRVMQIVNNYDHEWQKFDEFGGASYGSGIFNGDMGKIEKIISEINEVYVQFDDGRYACYSFTELDEIVLSYAITIHKSQGSEFPIVIIPIVGGSPLMMNKNLLYTAVTRAKRAVILIGKRSNVFYMVSNKISETRNTMLKELLLKNFTIFDTQNVKND